MEELTHLRFAGTAKLFTDAGFPDTIKGVVEPTTEAYGLKAAITGGGLTLTLTSPHKKSGQIVLPLLARLTRFEVDTRETRPRPNGPPLYKEWRLAGAVTLGGILAAANTHARATLILHGRGNSCTSATDFTHWTVAVTGTDTQLTLLGELIGATAVHNTMRKL